MKKVIGMLQSSVLVIPSFSAFAQAPELSSSLLNVFLSLVGMLVLIFVLASLVKKTNIGQLKSGPMKVVSVLPLTNREKVVLVEVGDQHLLLGVSAQSVHLLKEYNEKIPLPESEFKQTLSQLLPKGKKS